MAKTLKTPGVYIQEVSAFPNSIAQVETAIPAFIGYTERDALKNIPTRITSLSEYSVHYGGAPTLQYDLKETSGQFETWPTDKTRNYILYHNLRLYFNNGGGACYIVSVGSYDDKIEKGDQNLQTGLLGALPSLKKEKEPTIIVIPEATNLPDALGCYDTYNQLLLHCENLKNRVAILDVYDGYLARSPIQQEDVIHKFRNTVQHGLSFGAAYYPWLHTSIVEETEINYTHFSSKALDLTRTLLSDEANVLFDASKPDEAKKQKTFVALINNLVSDPKLSLKDIKDTHESLLIISPTYKNIIAALKTRINLLPPAAAMAGVYVRTDNNRGVFHAPANTGLASVSTLSVQIDNNEQQDLNTPLNGKAINAIRSFPGMGILVWGARTLDGNSLDWRYINVRRTLIMFEQSIKNGLQAFVFEPNDANTWNAVKNLIDNFLTNQWRLGALAGSTPDDAFAVHVGFGSTMTAQDILKGLLRVHINVALTRPAEFITITLVQKMQTS